MAAADKPDWREHGACLSADPDLFFPISSDGASRQQERQAKAVCAGCEVRTACLAFALESGQVHGVWGGLGEEELKRLRRSRPILDASPSREQLPTTSRVVPGLSNATAPRV